MANLTKKDVEEIVRETIKEMQKKNSGVQKEKELEQIEKGIEDAKSNEQLTKEEREMFLNYFEYLKKFTVAKYEAPEKLDAHVKEREAYDVENKIQSIKIATNDGQGNVELRVNTEAIEGYNKLQKATGEYWKTLTDMLNAK